MNKDVAIICGGIIIWSISLYFGEVLWYWPEYGDWLTWAFVISLTVYQLALVPLMIILFLKDTFIKKLEKNNIKIKDEFRIDFVNVIVGSLYGPVVLIMLLNNYFSENKPLKSEYTEAILSNIIFIILIYIIYNTMVPTQ